MFTHLPTMLFFLVASIALPAHAGIQQTDFSGIGHIYVLASDNWKTATPQSSVGCLDAHGKFVLDSGSAKECGVFERRDDFPYTLSGEKGNCTFMDEQQEQNTDSYYGKGDFAWSCKEQSADIYDELYTISGFPYVFLCFGDVACYYDAKRTPSAKESLPLWQYRWGSHQMGITPGHIQLQLLWEKIGDGPERSKMNEVLGPRVQISDDVQIALTGKRSNV